MIAIPNDFTKINNYPNSREGGFKGSYRPTISFFQFEFTVQTKDFRNRAAQAARNQCTMKKDSDRSRLVNGSMCFLVYTWMV